MTASSTTVIVTDSVGTVLVLSSWYFPVPRKKETRERFILRVPFINAHLEFIVCCGLSLVFKNISVIGQTGGNTCVLFIISDGASLEKQQMIIREKTQKHLDDYARRGLRTLCIAKKVRLCSTLLMLTHKVISFRRISHPLSCSFIRGKIVSLKGRGSVLILDSPFLNFV